MRLFRSHVRTHACFGLVSLIITLAEGGELAFVVHLGVIKL